MKLPKPISMHTAPGRSGHAPARSASPAGGVRPAAVAFSPRWDHYSWSRQGLVSQNNEVALILEMIRNSDSADVRGYAASGECGVYVRTGLHTSATDPEEHVQVQLGLNQEPWQNQACPRRTCHIRYEAGRLAGYPTQCWNS